MKNESVKKSNRIFRSFFLSHLLVGAIVLALLSFVMIYSLKNYYDDLLSFQRNLLLERKRELDIKLQNVEDISKMLSDESSIIQAGYYTDEKPEDRISFSNLKSFLYSCDQILNKEGSVYLYFNRSNSVLALPHHYNRHSLDTFSSYYFSLSEDAFLNFVERKPGYYILHADTENPQLILLSPIFDKTSATDLGKVLVRVSLPALVQESMHDKMDSDTLFYITHNEDVLCIGADEDGNFYFARDGLTEITSLSEGFINIHDAKNNVNKYYLIDALSEHNGWHYKIAIPEKLLTGRANYYIILLLVGILVAGIVSLIIALREARRFYTPAERLLKALDVSGAESYTKALTSAEQSALQYRDQLISKDRELTQFEEHKKEEALVSLCNGLLSEKETVTLLKKFGYSTDVHRKLDYRVLLITLENIHESVFSKNGETDYNMLQFVMKNIFSEILYEKPLENAPIAFFNPQTCVALVENMSEEELYRRLSAMKPFFNETLNIKGNICISEAGRNVLDIPEFYQQVYELHGYKTFWGDSQDDILFYSNVEDITPYDSGDTSRKKLFNLISVGNYADARKELEAVLDNSFSKNLSSVPLERIRIYGLLNDLSVRFDSGNSEKESSVSSGETAVGYEPPEGGDEIYASGLNLSFDNNFALMKLLSEIPRYRTYTELKDGVLNLFDRMTEHQASEEQKDDVPSWIKDVKKYVETNYQDPSLNIAALADEYKLTPAYLSRTYKKYTNTGLLDYIHLIRVEQAKKLLDKGSTVHDAALSVGYTEARALIRYFKRYEGITPGQYQEKR